MGNVERLKELKAWGLAEEAAPTSRLDMDDWAHVQIESPNVCGTTMCIAGKAASLAEPEAWAQKVADVSVFVLEDEYEISEAFSVIGDCRAISDVAREWIDLTEQEAEELFHSANIGDRYRREVGIPTWLEVIDHLIEKYS